MFLPTLGFLVLSLLGSSAEEYPSPHIVIVGPTGAGFRWVKEPTIFKVSQIQARVPWPTRCSGVIHREMTVPLLSVILSQMLVIIESPAQKQQTYPLDHGWGIMIASQ